MSELSAPHSRSAGVSSGTLLQRRAFAHAGLMIGAILLTLIMLLAVLAPLLAPYDPYAQDLSHRLVPRSGTSTAAWRTCSGPTISDAITCRASSTAHASPS